MSATTDQDAIMRTDHGSSNVVEWESFWSRLLREYESVCRELEPDNPRYACGQSGILHDLDQRRHHHQTEEGEIH